jgi:hypothetical protein
MGNSNSSYLQDPNTFDHKLKELSIILCENRFIRNIYFHIDTVDNYINKINMFMSKILVLDVDATLGQAIYDHDLKNNEILKKKLLDNQYMFPLHHKSMYFYVRPFFKEFIRFCLRNFKEVIIWTNGVQDYANSIGKIIEDIHGVKLKCFSRNSSSPNLQKIMSNIDLNPTDVWMLDDDSIHNCKDNFGLSFFQANPFNISTHLLNEDFINFTVYDDFFYIIIVTWFTIYNKNLLDHIIQYKPNNNTVFIDY